MTAYLMTRGTPRRLDYRFLGPTPGTPWWDPVTGWINLTEPEVVVQGAPDGARILVSGIPSGRRDAIGTAIRFTLVIDRVEPDLLPRVVAAGLDPTRRAWLGARLDDSMPSDWVDAVLGGRQPEGEGIDTRLARVLGTLKDTPVPKPGGTGTSWVGARGDPRAESAFLARALRLGGDVPGWAITATLLSTIDGARRAALELGVPVAMLLAENGPDEIIDLGPDPGKASAGVTAGPRNTLRPVITGHGPDRHRGTLRIALVAASVLVALTILGLAAWLTWASGPTAPASPAPPSSPSPSSTPPATPGKG